MSPPKTFYEVLFWFYILIQLLKFRGTIIQKIIIKDCDNCMEMKLLNLNE